MKQHFEFVTFYVRGYRGHSMGAKSILKIISQISAHRQHVHTPFITKLSIFDRKRANRFGTNQYETPCNNTQICSL